MRRIYRFTLLAAAATLLMPLAGSRVASAQQKYSDYKRMTSFLKELSEKHKKVMTLKSYGSTIGKKEIWGVTLSEGDADKKPAMLVVGGVNGIDLAGTEYCLYFIESVLNEYGKTDSVAQLIRERTVYIFPAVSPDASETYFAKVRYERTLNARAYDLDRDGSTGEDGFDDLNGDGLITMMRIEDPKGDWLPDKDDPQLMRKADASKGEKGIYRLIKEGKDNDGDGEFNEDEPGGVDFNKNFTFNYKYFSEGAGFHQVSEVESRAVADFAFSHPNIAVVFSFTPDGNLTSPWKPKKGEGTGKGSSGRSRMKPVTAVLSEDSEYLDKIGEKFKKITGLEGAPEPEKNGGSFSEWAYFHYGRWSLGAPSWWAPEIREKPDTSSVDEPEPDKEKKKEKSKAGKKPMMGKKEDKNDKDPLKYERNLLKWLNSNDRPGDFVQWKSVSHPDFPGKKVEVGGFAPFIKTNPPADSLDSQSRKFTKFLLHLGSLLPKLSLERMEVERLQDRVYRLTAFVTNEGYLPTSPKLGDRNKWAPKVRVTLRLNKNQKIAAGRVNNLLDAVAGSGGSEEVSWIIIGSKGSNVSIEAGSSMAGVVVKTVTLK